MTTPTTPEVVYSPLDIDRAQKAQWIRLADVVLIGPLMTYGGTALYREGHSAWGVLLGVLGVGTVLYNGRNYLRVRTAIQRAS